MYLTYDEYEDMGGTLDETTYESVEFEARTFIDWVTFNRLENETDIPEKVKRCMYELIMLIQTKRASLVTDTPTSDSENASVASVENDGVRVSYNVMSATELYDKSYSDIKRITHNYLSGVKNSAGKVLTYRGLYEDE